MFLRASIEFPQEHLKKGEEFFQWLIITQALNHDARL
jgi:hypothetical protein